MKDIGGKSIYFVLNPKEIGHYEIYLDDLAFSKASNYIKNINNNYQFMDGTSMATPFVTAAVAIDSNIYNNKNAIERKERILKATRSSNSLINKVTTAGVIDLEKFEGAPLNKEVLNIEVIKEPNKVNYTQNEKELDLTGGQIEITYIDGTKQKLPMTIQGLTITGYNSSIIGQQVITISYKGKEATFIVTVEKGIEVNIIDYTEQKEQQTTYLLGIDPKTKISKLKLKIETNGDIEIYKGGTKIESEESIVGTEYKLKITKGNQIKEYILVVKGDSNGDGKADFNDILKINKHRLNKAKLEGAYIKAGDINQDKKADFTDILKINKFRLGKIKEL